VSAPGTGAQAAPQRGPQLPNPACDVTVLICTRDRASSLSAVFPTLAAQQVPAGWTVEVIVVDNGSRDGTAELVRAQTAFGSAVRLVQEPEKGLSRARNAGLRAARGRVLLFTDDDVRLPPGWVADMARPVLEGRADAVAGSVRLAPHLLRPWMEPYHRATLAATDLLLATDPGVMMGASMGFGRHVLERVPCFDENLGAGALGTAEDSLFAWQLVDAGYRITHVSDVEVEHHCEPDRLQRAAYVAAARKLGRSYAYIAYHWLHETHLGLEAMNVWQLGREALLCILRLARWRLRQRARGRLPEEGILHPEFYLLMRQAFVHQYIRERRGERRYHRRGGTAAPGTTGRIGETEPSVAHG
jgi:glucosyl-dolichyl phosphate glucuronosyltransferase